MLESRFQGLINLQQKVLSACSDLQAIMRAVVSEFSVMPQANGIVVELREGDQIVYAAASGTSESLIGLRLPLNSSLSGMSVLTGRPLTCDDSETDSRVNRVACRRVNLRSMIVVPIPHLGQTVGVLKYYSPDVSAFAEEDMMLAHLLVGPLAVGFSNVGESDAERVSQELRDLIQLKQHFVAMVTHELRTPLTSISGSLSLIAGGAGGELPERAASIVGIAARNAERMKRLVDDLLTFEGLRSESPTLNTQDVELNSIVSAAIEEAAPYAQQTSATVELHTEDNEVWADVDGDRLIQAVTNLISNAVKFSPRGGTVKITVAIDGDRGLIRVKDEGPGVSQNFRKQLFQPFAHDKDVQTSTGIPSTGLGLAITKSMVEQMGGKVWLDETTTIGAAFVISLPLSAASAVPSKVPNRKLA